MAAFVLLISACAPDYDSDGATESAVSPTSEYFTQSFTGPIDGDAVTIEISDKLTSKTFRRDNIGLSFESTELADPRIDPAASNLDELLNHLGDPALRFGGNELDRRVFWTSAGEKATKPEQVVVTPDDLRRLKKLVDATGSTVTIGIPLGTYDPQRGADMATHAVDILGDSLVGLAIGNEPNGYAITSVPNGAVRGSGWNTAEYRKQLDGYVSAIHAKRPDAPIIGPDVYDGEWMDAFLDSDVKNTAALSQHWYQLYECSSTEVPGRGPQAQNLIDPLAKDSAEKILDIGLSKAEGAGIPLWLEETGTTSCPGTNDTSRTHATALWAVDYSLFAATLGVERMAMHSMLGACLGGAPMSLVCDPADHGSRSSTFSGRPHYSALRLLVPSTGGSFLHTTVKGGGNISAYTVSKDEGNTLVTTIVNANDAKSSGGNPVTLTAPQGYRVAEAAQVHAPSNEAKNATAVHPSTPLPETVPYSGPARPSDDPKMTEFDIDLSASSATVLILRKERTAET
ncbi:hypothetical protein DFO66_11246 [Brevibacterium sanguinis]|uniref:Glycosyl hydrolase family 79 n=2 Tax=Brevibacterium TaxID=1696 RepID=A0A366IED1_9MICO|nr:MULTISPECIES: hypothetical protein [Brevibacterium]RBP62942.1 hypothetical protein DFO66_11246 [Brevibacterium sanguinis]RBP69513.1 hypothetical protein DFO65_11247 [Brevibacterium celere]